MKRFHFLIFISLIVFSSCSSDDMDIQNEKLVDITGSWNLVNYEQSGESTSIQEGQTFIITYSGFGRDFDAQYIFSENPNTVQFIGSFTYEFTSFFMGTSETQVDDFHFDPENVGAWSIDENQLEIEFEFNDDLNYSIGHLSENKMILISEHSFVLENSSGWTRTELILER